MGTPNPCPHEEVSKARVVFDTNTVVSALLFGGRRSSALREAWNRCTPLGNEDTVRELDTVLRYPKFKLDEALVLEFLGEFVPLLEIVPTRRPCPARCRDGDDQPFLDLAHGGRASVLVTGDGDLLALAGNEGLRFRILTPAEFLDRGVPV